MTRKQPTKTLQLTQPLLEAIQGWAARYDRPDSEVMRLALIEGLKTIARDPGAILGPLPVRPEDISPPPHQATAEIERAREAGELPRKPRKKDAS